MVNIPQVVTEPLDKSNLASLNKKRTAPISKENVFILNARTRRVDEPVPQARVQQPVPQARPQPQPTLPRLPDMVMPRLVNPLRKGQKTSLDPQNRGLRMLKACFGWNIIDARCDMDASAFLTAATGKVPGDDWFVFYGQEVSPDNSVRFMEDPSGKDREIITINLQSLNSSIQKIVFVLTINEAFENHLNFSMIKDAYVRILDGVTNQELVSYKLEEYYANVTSMTIGELYLHNGQWKFNPVGNGVNRDLAGQCAMYGVEIA